MNKVTLFGRVGKDPELKNTNSGKTVCNFSLATNDFKDNVEWHRIVAWEKTAEIIEKYVKKGDQLLVSGRISYQENDGKYYTNIVVENVEFSGSKKELPVRTQEKDDIPF